MISSNSLIKISRKEDSPEKLKAVQHIDQKYYIKAQEFNQIVECLNLLLSTQKKVKTINDNFYELSSEDVNFILNFTSQNEITVMISDNLTDSFRVEGKQLGNGSITFKSNRININTHKSQISQTAGKYSVFAVEKINYNSCIIYGNLKQSVKCFG